MKSVSTRRDNVNNTKLFERVMKTTNYGKTSSEEMTVTRTCLMTLANMQYDLP